MSSFPRWRGCRNLHGVALGLALLASGCASSPYRVQHLAPSGDGPRILCVVAHPDDEISFAGTLYKTATELDGTCDVVVVTNGEGGFKYSTLAEPIYGLELTDEEVGRAHLPALRERELLAGCELLGVRDVILLGERDHRYTQDVGEILGAGAAVWDLERVRSALADVLARGYDVVLLLAPTAETHAHHKAATILTLEVLAGLPAEERPAALCVRLAGPELYPWTPTELPGHPVTRPAADEPFVFDRTEGIGFDGRLDYRIIANWAIAEHKSQGTMQLLVNRGDRELYHPFALTTPAAMERARALFEALQPR